MTNFRGMSDGEKAETRARLAATFTQMMVEANIDVERGKAAMLAYTRWNSMSPVPDDHWMDCPYPGGVIAALAEYVA